MNEHTRQDAGDGKAMSAATARPPAKRSPFARLLGTSFLMRVLWAVVNYANVFLFARWLTGEHYGEFAFILSSVIFLSELLALGAPNTALRFVSQYNQAGDTGRERGVVAHFERLLLLALGGATLLALGPLAYIFVEGNADLAATYFVSIGLIYAFAFMDLQSSVIRAHGAIVMALGPKDVFWRLALIPLCLLVVWWLPAEHQLLGFMIGAVIAAALFTLQQRRAMNRLIPPDVRVAPPVIEKRTWSEVSVPIWIATVSASAFRTVDVIILGLIVSKPEVGLYFAASRTASLVSFVLVSTNVIIGGEVSRLYHSGKIDELRRRLRLVSLFVFAPAVAALAVFTLYGKEILGLMGPRFEEMQTVLLVLALGQVVNAATGSAGAVMNMIGQQKKAAEIGITTSIATSLAVLALGYMYGTLGAAIAMAIGLAVLNLRKWAAVRYGARVDPSILDWVLPASRAPKA